MPPDLTIPSRRLRRPLGECLRFEAAHLAAHIDAWRHEMPTAAAEWLDTLAERLSELAVVASRQAADAKRADELLNERVADERAAAQIGTVVSLRPTLAVIDGGRSVVGSA